MRQVIIKENCRFTKVQQIFNSLAADIESGRLKDECRLLSITNFSKKNNVARDTVEKAYRQLRKQGYITSIPGKGYFVVGKCRRQLKMLLIADKLSSFNVINYENLSDRLVTNNQGKSPIDICYLESFKDLTEERLKSYDYFILRPDFFMGR